jgi:hypothetical protein
MERVSNTNLSFICKLFILDKCSHNLLSLLLLCFAFNQFSEYFLSKRQSVGIFKQLSTSIDLPDICPFCVKSFSLGVYQ